MRIYCYTERIKTVCEDRRTVEFCSKFAWISFIAFGEFLIHVNKFRDYKNSYLRSSLNTTNFWWKFPTFPIPMCPLALFRKDCDAKVLLIYLDFAVVTKLRKSGRNMQLLDTAILCSSAVLVCQSNRVGFSF
jgi:hypothetical protein